MRERPSCEINTYPRDSVEHVASMLKPKLAAIGILSDSEKLIYWESDSDKCRDATTLPHIMAISRYLHRFAAVMLTNVARLPRLAFANGGDERAAYQLLCAVFGARGRRAWLVLVSISRARARGRKMPAGRRCSALERG